MKDECSPLLLMSVAAEMHSWVQTAGRFMSCQTQDKVIKHVPLTWPEFSSRWPSKPKLHRVVLIRTDTPPIVPAVPLQQRSRWVGKTQNKRKTLCECNENVNSLPQIPHTACTICFAATGAQLSLSLLNHLHPQWPGRCDTQWLKYFKDKMTGGWIDEDPTSLLCQCWMHSGKHRLADKN